jgi:NCS1 family nucleobase:cation symporter-1
MIHYTLDILAAFIGPLFGILLVDFYLIKKQKIDVDALFDDSPSGRYYFDGGVNWTAVKALVPATLAGVAITFTPALQGMANFAWFTGCFLGGLFFLVLARREQVRAPAPLVAG